MKHVLADQNLYKIEEFVPPGFKLTLYNPSHGLPDLEGAHALLVRTVTHLNEETLPNPPESLKFIGTGSSGTDHIDNEYIKHKGITLVDANGSNAQAVAEYVITSLLIWREENNPGKALGKVGVIGVGKAGSAVVNLLQKFGIDCIQYDPPRELREPGYTSHSLDEVLDCDILTFHVPLNKKGKYSTYHWLNEKKLDGRNYNLIINAARGGVIDELALMKAHVEGAVNYFIQDVWENEPDFNSEIAKHAFIATPHIAGYSEQAKVKATKTICSKLASFFNYEPAASNYKNLDKYVEFAHIQYNLKSLLTRLNPIKEYDAALRDLSYRPDKCALFQNLRNEFPYRYEYSCLKIRSDLLDEFEVLKLLGVRSITDHAKM